MKRPLVFYINDYLIIHTLLVVKHPIFPRLLYTKRTDALSQDLAKTRSHEIWVQTFPIPLICYMYLGSTIAETLVKIQRDSIIIPHSLVSSRFRETWRLVNMGIVSQIVTYKNVLRISMLDII